MTTVHPIRSLDRNDWVPLGELEEGEQLLGQAGPALVLSHAILHRSLPVYNIEVHGEHVYEVGELGLLVHSAYITNSGKTVLGHFPGYIDKARARGASYFDIGEAWNSLTEAQRWAANRHFLDKIADAGDQVLLSLPKTKIRPDSYLVKEIQYLINEKGYRWINQRSLGNHERITYIPSHSAFVLV